MAYLHQLILSAPSNEEEGVIMVGFFPNLIQFKKKKKKKIVGNLERQLIKNNIVQKNYNLKKSEKDYRNLFYRGKHVTCTGGR